MAIVLPPTGTATVDSCEGVLLATMEVFHPQHGVTDVYLTPETVEYLAEKFRLVLETLVARGYQPQHTD